MLKNTIILSICSFLFNMNLQAIRDDVGIPGRLSLGVPLPTPSSTYLPSAIGNLANSTAYTGIRSNRPRIINREAYTNCREKCLLNDEACLNDCLCLKCWRESIGSQPELIDYCRCLSPDTTGQQHF